jgi:hypothetical protein
VPQSGDGGVGVAIISYCDQIMLSVHSDVGQLAPGAAADKQHLTAVGGKTAVPLEVAFYDEVQRLKALAQAKLSAADADHEPEADDTGESTNIAEAGDHHDGVEGKKDK